MLLGWLQLSSPAKLGSVACPRPPVLWACFANSVSKDSFLPQRTLIFIKHLCLWRWLYGFILFMWYTSWYACHRNICHSRDATSSAMVNDSVLWIPLPVLRVLASVLSETLTCPLFQLLGSYQKIIELGHGLTCLLSQPLGKVEAGEQLPNQPAWAI